MPLGGELGTNWGQTSLLAARDRPSKKAVPDDRALDILRGEARRGVIDSDLLDLFIGSEVYRAAPQKK